MSNTAQGTIRISRLRNGDTVTTVLELNGKPLQQIIDANSGEPSPNWQKDESSRPTLTPKCYSSRAAKVSLEFVSWSYNDTVLVWGTLGADGYRTDTTGKFKKEETTGALTIIDNIASAANTSNDTLTYKGKATVNGMQVDAEAAETIKIHQGGASSWTCSLTAVPAVLESADSTSLLATTLTLGVTPQTNYYVKWKNGGTGEYITKWAGKKSVTVERDDVDGITYFIAEFYKSSADEDMVARDGVKITDNTDEFKIDFRVDSDNSVVDDGKPVKLTAFVYSMRKGAEVTSLTDASWQLRVMDGETWEQIGDTVNSPSIEISTSHTDYTDKDGVAHQRDVNVLADVSFS